MENVIEGPTRWKQYGEEEEKDLWMEYMLALDDIVSLPERASISIEQNNRLIKAAHAYYRVRFCDREA